MNTEVSFSYIKGIILKNLCQRRKRSFYMCTFGQRVIRISNKNLICSQILSLTHICSLIHTHIYRVCTYICTYTCYICIYIMLHYFIFPFYTPTSYKKYCFVYSLICTPNCLIVVRPGSTYLLFST